MGFEDVYELRAGERFDGCGLFNDVFLPIVDVLKILVPYHIVGASDDLEVLQVGDEVPGRFWRRRPAPFAK